MYRSGSVFGVGNNVENIHVVIEVVGYEFDGVPGVGAVEPRRVLHPVGEPVVRIRTLLEELEGIDPFSPVVVVDIREDFSHIVGAVGVGDICLEPPDVVAIVVVPVAAGIRPLNEGCALAVGRTSRVAVI